jgi:hypothetical protein
MEKYISARTAVMKQAYRAYRSLNRRETTSDWPFSRCLRLAHHEIAGKRDTFAFAEVEKAMRGIPLPAAGGWQEFLPLGWRPRQ